MAVVSSPSSPAPTPEKKNSKWLRRGNRKLIGRYLGEARAALAAAAAARENGDDGVGDDAAAAAALGMAAAALELAPRMEAALELRARALLALRRYRDVADMLRDYIPSCVKSDDTVTSSSCSSGDSRAGLLSPGRDDLSGAGRFLCCFDVADIKRRVVAGLSKNSIAETEWRYLVLGQACFHLGLMEDAVVLLQTGRRLASAAFRRESVCWSEDSFSPSSNSTASRSSSGSPAEADAVSQLLAHVKLLLRRRAAGSAALDAGLPAEAARHFSKVLDARRGGAPKLPHSFAAACLVGRAAAFSGAGKVADAIADCNRALALDPAFIPALRARADLLESINAIAEALRDMDHLKLLYDAALRDGKLPGPAWRPQGGVRHGEIAGAHRSLVARIRRLRGKLAAGEAGEVDYYLLLGVRRGCTRPEVVRRAFMVLTLRMKPEEQWRRTASFAERVELVDEFRDMDAVRDQARMSGMFLYRMVQKGYAHVMAAVVAEEKEEEETKQRAMAAVTELAAATAREEEEEEEATSLEMTEVEDDDVSGGNVEKGLPEMETRAMAAVAPAPETRVMTAMTAAVKSPPVFQQQGAFCRDMAVVGALLSRGGGMEAMSC